jgi:hypothetical protein
VVVAVTENPPWEDTFTLPLAQTGPRGSWRICGHPECGHEFAAFTPPCARCAQPSCPQCDRCGCVPAVKERSCPGCFTVYPHTYFDGDRCRDCA